MGRKVGLAVGGLLAVFYLLSDPQSTASALRHMASGVGHVVPQVAHQLSVFLRSL